MFLPCKCSHPLCRWEGSPSNWVILVSVVNQVCAILAETVTHQEMFKCMEAEVKLNDVGAVWDGWCGGW